MLKIASVNLNKRFNNPEMRTRLVRWVQSRQLQVLCAEEPWKQTPKFPLEFANLEPVGGNEKVWCWIDSRLSTPSWVQIQKYAMRVELGYFLIYIVYLDAYQQGTRAAQLRELQRIAKDDLNRPQLWIGDFNIAPEPGDGLVGEISSEFNSDVDRRPLLELRDSLGLVDLGTNLQSKEWTIERLIKGRPVRFRCDLALTSNYVARSLEFQHDHTVRKGELSFTDHSALCLELPVTLPERSDQLTLFRPEQLNSGVESAFNFNPEKTAMHRREPTPIARLIASDLRKHFDFTSILDFGCGYGQDVRFYRSRGIDAEGYDPCETFGWTTKPNRKFDLVTLLFVLNVLADPWSRLKALQDAALFLSDNGLLVVATRSISEIESYASKKKWPRFNDGYWSHEGKGTFQKGLDLSQIDETCLRAGLVRSPISNKFRLSSSTTCAAWYRPTRS